VTLPSRPATDPATSGGGLQINVTSMNATSVHLRETGSSAAATYTLGITGSTPVDGLLVTTYSGRGPASSTPTTAPSSLTAPAIAKLNGGRLPLGLTAGSQTSYAVTYESRTSVSASVEPTTHRVVAAAVTTKLLATVTSNVGAIPLSTPAAVTRHSLPAATTAAAVAAARHDRSAMNERSDRRTIEVSLAAAAVILLLGAGGSAFGARRQRTTVATPSNSLVGHQVSLT
jgi:hypothetical protein